MTCESQHRLPLIAKSVFLCQIIKQFKWCWALNCGNYVSKIKNTINQELTLKSSIWFFRAYPFPLIKLTFWQEIYFCSFRILLQANSCQYLLTRKLYVLVYDSLVFNIFFIFQFFYISCICLLQLQAFVKPFHIKIQSWNICQQQPNLHSYVCSSTIHLRIYILWSIKCYFQNQSSGKCAKEIFYRRKFCNSAQESYRRKHQIKQTPIVSEKTSFIFKPLNFYAKKILLANLKNHLALNNYYPIFQLV